jgi:hypothetical protein
MMVGGVQAIALVAAVFLSGCDLTTVEDAPPPAATLITPSLVSSGAMLIQLGQERICRSRTGCFEAFSNRRSS